MDFRGQPEIERNYGLSGTEPVINQGCMYMRRVDASQVEWYRDNDDNYYRLKHFVWGGFLYYLDEVH